MHREYLIDLLGRECRPDLKQTKIGYAISSQFLMHTAA